MIPIKDRNPRHAPAIVTWVLVALNVLVFIHQLRLGDTRAGYEFIMTYAFVPADFFANPGANLASVFTSAFMHGGISHIVSNMIFLLVFGDNVEDRMGKFVYTLFYLGGAAVATLLHGLFEMSSNTPLVGASGAISAVLGAYILMFPKQQVLTFIPPLFFPWLVLSLFMRVKRFFALWLPAWIYIGYWAVVQFWEAGRGLVLTSAVGEQQVAWWAHVGGFVFGLALVWLGLGRRKRPPPDLASWQRPPA